MNPVIKDFLDNGYIDKEAAARLEEFEEMAKEASFGGALLKGLKGFGTMMAPAIPMAVGAVLGDMAADYFDKKEVNKIEADTQNELDYSFNSMMNNNQALKKNPELAAKRFNEIAAIAPDLAKKSPSVTGQLVQKTLNRGLNADEMAKVTQIQNNINTGLSRDIPRSTTGKAIGTMISTIGDAMSSQMMDAGAMHGSSAAGS